MQPTMSSKSFQLRSPTFRRSEKKVINKPKTDQKVVRIMVVSLYRAGHHKNSWCFTMFHLRHSAPWTPNFESERAQVSTWSREPRRPSNHRLDHWNHLPSRDLIWWSWTNEKSKTNRFVMVPKAFLLWIRRSICMFCRWLGSQRPQARLHQ